MKITMLGTATIDYPLAFCNCENCNDARNLNSYYSAYDGMKINL